MCVHVLHLHTHTHTLYTSSLTLLSLSLSLTHTHTHTHTHVQLLIPHSVANSTHSPPLLLQYGHGLFGSQSEVETGYLEAEANQYGYILFACDWWGMSQLDVPTIALMIGTNISDFSIIPDRLTQGMLNAHILMRLVKVCTQQCSVCAQLYMYGLNTFYTVYITEKLHSTACNYFILCLCRKNIYSLFVNMLLKMYIFLLFIKRVRKNENTVNNVYECSHASYQGSQSSSYIKNCHLHL